MKKRLSLVIALVLLVCLLSGCEYSSTRQDMSAQIKVADNFTDSQPTPTDLKYSLERDNLIRRAYWVNGQREKAISMPCPVERPLGYIVLLLESVGVVGRYVVNGKVTSLNSFLTPDSTYYGGDTYSYWLADVDGSYGQNDNGIFFFTPDGKYIEWTGTYLYSDIPFEVEDPILKVEGGS